MITDEEGRDQARRSDGTSSREIEDEPMWDQPGCTRSTGGGTRSWPTYDGDRMAVGGGLGAHAGGHRPLRARRRAPPGLQLRTACGPWSAPAFGKVIETTLAALAEVAGSPTWVLSNHDVHRTPPATAAGKGLARARAATLVSLALPGSAYLYQGEELGLRGGRRGAGAPAGPVVAAGPASPVATAAGCRSRGRRPAAVGFGPGAEQPWIPPARRLVGLSVAAQAGDPASTLEFYRTALAARRAWSATRPPR